MKIPRAFGLRFLLLLFAPLLLPTPAHATGIESPRRWIEQGGEPPLLESPEFYFELEARRLAAELHPGATAKLPVPKESDLGYGRQAGDADLADFNDALAKKKITPPDAEKARAAHVAMRAQINVARGRQEAGEAPLALVESGEFASEFTDYHRGALSMFRGDAELAEATWKALLARPAAERHYRTTWAEYMLGRFAIVAEEWDAVRTHFAQVRQAVEEGCADSVGLAAASFGWEAFGELHSKRYPEAARLYLQQLATGDTSAVNSLRVVMEEIFKEDADLNLLVHDPVLQRLGTAGAVAGMAPFPWVPSDGTKDDLAAHWLLALESADAKNVRDADRVAWIAYNRGDYAKATRWLSRAPADAPYVLWLKAKFALRDGKLDVATKLLAQAVEKLPIERRVEAYNIEGSSLSPYDTAHADLAVLRLHRSEFLAALRLFLEGGMHSDAFYVADGVLTIDELKTFVAKDAPKLKKLPDDAGEKPATDETKAEAEEPVWHFYYYTDPEGELRSILARRLIRAGQYAAARSYLDPEPQGWLDEYVALLDRAQRKGASKSEQAEAFWKAAQVMIDHGHALADYFDPVSMAQRTSGRVVDTGDTSMISMKYGERDEFVPPVAAAEQQRLKKNAVPVLRRYYSTYLAADLGWRSAALMPDNDEKTADRLNRAGSLLKDGDEAAADRFYQAIERRCAKTELGKAAIKKHWFVKIPDEEASSR